MNNVLMNINGFKIANLPFQLEKIGDLIYFEGSLMGVFTDSSNNSFICDWVDSDDKFNRWLIYQVEVNLLAEYIFQKITHFKLLNNPVNNVIFIVDKDKDGVITNCTICPPSNLPYEYLPEIDIKFEDEDSKNLDNIKSILNINEELIPNSSVVFNILEEAKKANSELINIHIKSSSHKVGYGKIYSSILGRVLSNYSDLSTSTALNLYDSKSQISKEERPRRKNGELKNIKELAELEFVYAKAASFSIFLRPITKQFELFGRQSSSENIAKTIFNLFDASKDLNNLNELKSTLNEGMLSSYNSFLKEIKEDDLSICVQYANPAIDFSISDSFNGYKAQQILRNLDSLEFENKSEVKTKGYFKALDSIKGTFKFETIEDDIYEGKFSEQLKEGIYFFNLQNSYQVTIDIVETKKSGTKKIHEKDIMVSCVKIES